MSPAIAPRHAAVKMDANAELSLVLEEIVNRLLQAKSPSDVQHLVQEYPEYAQQLQEVLPAIRMLAGANASCQPAPMPLPSPAPTDLKPRILGDYRILREIGRGGMGVVYEAEQISLGRRVALKVLPFAGMWDERQLQRFKNEARAAATLDHPGIVSVHSVGCERGVHYYAMQLIEGQSLAEVIAVLRLATRERSHGEQVDEQLTDSTRPPMCDEKSECADSANLARGDGTDADDAATADACPARPIDSPSTADLHLQQAEISTDHATNQPKFFRTVARLGVQAAEALDHAHQRGVIHRDIKPGNLLIDSVGKLWITDFGLARIEGDASITMTGDLVGTWRYMSPEQLSTRRAVVDHRADIYSFGATIYELLTLRPAFSHENREKLFQQIAHEEPRAPRQIEKAIPRDLETIVLKAMRKNAAERYATAQTLADDLHRFLNHQPIKAKRPTIVERVTKWSHRHTAIVWSTVALLVMAVVALSIGTALISRAWLETQVANEELAVRSYAQQIAHADLALAYDDTAQARQSLAGCAAELRGWEWQHLNLLSDLSDRTLAGSWAVAFSPDGKTLVSGGPEACGEVFQGAVEPSPDGSLEARCWDAATGELLWTKDVDVLWSLTYSPDGKLVAAGLGHRVALWKADTGRPVQGLAASSMYVVFALAFDPNGRTFAFSDNKWLKVSDAKTGELLWAQPAHGKTRSIAYSPDGQQIATAGRDKTIKLWDAAAGDLLRTLAGHKGEVHSVCYSPDGKRIASAAADRFVKVWDVASGETLMILEGHRDSVNAVAFSPNGHRIASVGRDATLRLWDADNGKGLRTLHGHTDEVTGVAYSFDGQTIATTGRDGVVKMWDASPGQPQFRLSGHGQWAVLDSQDNQTNLAFSGDGKRIVSAGAKDAIRLWNAHTGEELLDICDVFGDVVPVAFLADGQHVVSGCSDGTLRIWDAADGRRLHTWKIHSQAIRTLSVSLDGKRIATGSDDKTVKVWDLPTAQVRLTLSGHQGAVSTVAFSPDGRRIASGSKDKSVRLWDAETGKSLRTLNGHDGEIQTVAFSSRSKQIVSCSTDKSLRIWNVKTGQLLRTLLGHKSGVTCASFSPDDTRLASGSLDETVKLWEAHTGQELVTLRPRVADSTGAHATTVCSVRFSPDGQTLAAGIDDGSIQIWESARPLAGYRARQLVDSARQVLDRWAQEYDDYAAVVEQLRTDDTLDAETLDAALRIAGVRKLPSSSLNRRGKAKHEERRHEEALADLTEAIRLNPTYGEAYKNRGLVYLGMREFDKALAELTEAIRVEPIAWFYADRANMHDAACDVDASIADYTEAIRIEPEFDAAFNNRGMMHLKNGDWDKALADLTEAIRLKPLATFYRNRGDVHAERDLAKAIADYTEAIRLDPAPVMYNNRSFLHARNSDLEAAVADQNRAIRLEPEAKLFYLNRAGLHDSMGNLDEALADLTEAIRLDPKFALAYNNRGKMYLKKGDKHCALADVNEAVRLDPKPLHYANRGDLSQDIGELDGALADYTEAIRLDPQFAFPYNQRGAFYYRKGEFEKALTDYSEAVRYEPKHAMPRTNRGNAYRQLGELDKALADYEVAIELDPDCALAYVSRGRTRLENGDLNKALDDLTEAVRLDPQYAEACCYRAFARFRLGQADEAQKDIERAAMITPVKHSHQNQLAWLLATSPHAPLRRVDRAVELAQSVVAARAQWGSHWRTLGVARYRVGDWEGAREALEKSLPLCSDRHSIASTLFLAMSHWQLGDKARARALFDQATVSMSERDDSNEGLRRIRAEAAELMGLACEVGAQNPQP